MLSDRSWRNEAGHMILLSEVLGEERLDSSLVTCGLRGRHLTVRKRRFSAEVEEFYICTVETVKKVCPCQNTLNYALHKEAYNCTYVHFSTVDFQKA